MLPTHPSPVNDPTSHIMYWWNYFAFKFSLIKNWLATWFYRGRLIENGRGVATAGVPVRLGATGKMEPVKEEAELSACGSAVSAMESEMTEPVSPLSPVGEQATGSNEESDESDVKKLSDSARRRRRRNRAKKMAHEQASPTLEDMDIYNGEAAMAMGEFEATEAAAQMLMPTEDTNGLAVNLAEDEVKTLGTAARRRHRRNRAKKIAKEQVQMALEDVDMDVDMVLDMDMDICMGEPMMIAGGFETIQAASQVSRVAGETQGSDVEPAVEEVKPLSAAARRRRRRNRAKHLAQAAAAQMDDGEGDAGSE